ncbi:ALDH-like protein [Agrocybe pediades]|nr:ALDH-like protein [Agrocybe pediades]
MAAPPIAQLYINGQFVPASNGETFEVRNPYSGKVVTVSASATSADCKAAVDAAAEAFKTWERTTLATRRDIFLKAADLVKTDKYRDMIIESTKEETDAASYYAYFNWFMAADALRTQAALVEKLRGEIYPSGVVPGAEILAERRALGVVFGIAPWNAPFVLSLRAIGVAIICGNTTVLKSSEFSPRGHAAVVELFHEAGLPPGVLNFVSVSRENAPTLTAELIAHPAVRSVNFTGSDRIGRIIALEAAKHLKPCILELGGKSPAIVFNDADIIEAAKCIVFAAFGHSSQVCMATARVLMQSGIADKLFETIKDLVKNLKAGDLSRDHAANMGALFAESSAENAVAMVKDAVNAGAEVVVGDMSKEGPIIQPHLVKNVKPGMWLWEREVFAPVLSFATFETVEEALELANASDYSLSAAVYTNDWYLARDVGSRIRSGLVNINGPSFHSEPVDTTMGLGGASGYARFDIEAFTQKRVTIIHPRGRKLPLVD